MEEELTLDNLLSSDEIENLFVDNETQETPPETSEEKPDETGNEQEKNETTEVDVDSLFTTPEGVGSEDNKEEKEDTNPQGNGSSPKNDFFSSTAMAFAEEGIFPDLDIEEVKKVTSAEDFKALMEKQMKAGLDDMQKRVTAAIEVGVEDSEIKRYENTFKYLDSLDDDAISDESEKGETLRKQLIYQDYINKGFSKERAAKAVDRSFAGGNDIEDAKEALKSNKDFFKSEYENLIEEAKAEQEKFENERKEQARKLKESILEDKKVFGEIEVDKATRQKVFDNISKPIHKDPETGEWLTAIQKYEMEHKTEFLKNLGLIFTLTDGFKNLDGLVKGKVRKEVKKGLAELEHTLNNTARTSGGALKFASGVDSDPESFIGKITLDI